MFIQIFNLTPALDLIASLINNIFDFDSDLP